MHKWLAFTVLIVLAFASASSAAGDPMSRLKELVGNWTCTYRTGSQQSSFSASFAFTQDGNWLRETDAWPGGGDEGLITYAPATRTWTTMVADSGRGATILQAKDTGTSTLDYHSVFPDRTMTVTYQFVSAERYLVHAAIAGAHPTTSADTCTKK